MINLENLRLSDILPERLKTKEILAVTNALDQELKEITKSIYEIIIMPRIDEMPEDIVDSLAWQLHVDFYEPLGLDLDKKRALVKNSLDWHRRKGTKSVVVDIMRTLFFEDFRIEEWFEYGGKPFFFRAIVGGEPRSEKELGEAMMAIDVTKNVRSWLDYIVFEHDIESDIFIAGMMEDDISELFAMMDHPDDIETTLYSAAIMEDYITDIIEDGPPQEITTQTFIAVTFDEIVAELFAPAEPLEEIAVTLYKGCAFAEHIEELFDAEAPDIINTNKYNAVGIAEYIKEEFQCP